MSRPSPIRRLKEDAARDRDPPLEWSFPQWMCALELPNFAFEKIPRDPLLNAQFRLIAVGKAWCAAGKPCLPVDCIRVWKRVIEMTRIHSLVHFFALAPMETIELLSVSFFEYSKRI